MAYTPNKELDPECLQVLALAAIQVIGEDAFSQEKDDDGLGLDEKLLQSLMVFPNSFNTKWAQDRGLQKHPKYKEVWDCCNITKKAETNLQAWVKDPANPSNFSTWLKSAIDNGKALYDDANGLSRSKKYQFYRIDLFPGGSGFSDIKKVFKQLLKNIKDAASDPKNVKFARSTAGKLYGELTMGEDKWNPADICAVEESKIHKWKQDISRFIEIQEVKLKKSSMHDDLIAFSKWLKDNGSEIDKLEIVDAMEDLYVYNKMLTTGMKDKEFVPISLKQAANRHPQVQKIQISEPKDIEKYFHMKVEQGDWIYRASNQMASVKFNIPALGSTEGNYRFDFRGSEDRDVMKNIDAILMRPGTSSAHGRMALSIVTKTVNLSEGTAAFNKLDVIRKKLWDKYTTAGMKGIGPYPNVFYDATVSRVHRFTDYRVFDNLQAEHVRRMKSKAPYIRRASLAFDRRYGFNKVGMPAIIADRERQSSIVPAIEMWAEYAEFLSKGGAEKTTKKEFMNHALGRSQWTVIQEAQKKKRTDKKQKKYDPKFVYNVTVAHTQAKYMKNKIQSYEAAWLIDPNAQDNPLSDQDKINILKSMWMYAASKGFMIFNKSNVIAYLLSGPYLKVAA